ncbi:hypothetical protein E1301_Tti023407 [Triplophysa tibetana]|uniref:Uncharacterized protein n=1 Tax=Triplophysa tibetana TaxID=1572043 RepID=A0A5A9PHZ4_9TELE|nr:hypothetical protein E1301_Tti023407 [Triplophysa tibetana]
MHLPQLLLFQEHAEELFTGTPRSTSVPGTSSIFYCSKNSFSKEKSTKPADCSLKRLDKPAKTESQVPPAAAAFTNQVDLTGQLQMERESDSEMLSATMANTLKVSETIESTADQEEDRFYDCDDTLPEEDTLTTGQTNVQCTETAQSDRLESDAGIEKDKDSDRLGNTYSINQSCLSTTSAENTLDSSDSDSGLKEQNNEDQEKSERFADDDEMRDGDSDSEFKEAASSDKVTEFDEEYLRELEKDLTDEEKESRRKESLELKEKGNTQFKSGEHVEAEESYTAPL